MGAICIFAPAVIGWYIDKSKHRDGPGWFIGLLIGFALYGFYLAASGSPALDD